jgi:hypothetical protein
LTYNIHEDRINDELPGVQVDQDERRRPRLRLSLRQAKLPYDGKTALLEGPV